MEERMRRVNESGFDKTKNLTNERKKAKFTVNKKLFNAHYDNQTLTHTSHDHSAVD